MGNLFSNCSSCCGGRPQHRRRRRRLSTGDSTGSSRRSLLGSESWKDEIWHDALMEHDENNDEEETFEVYPEELAIIKAELAKEFPKDCHYMSDAYILSVASKPYSKDMTIRRPLEYSMEKLNKVMEWRQQVGAPNLLDLVQLANDHSDCPPNVSKETWQNALALVNSLNKGGMYWHGLTKTGRPIIWIRTNRKPWRPHVEAELNALIVMADSGITEGMPKGITDFCCISHSHKPPPPHPQFAYGMLTGLVQGYPDRLQLLISAPVSSIVEFCMNLIMPLMPGRLQHKFTFFNLEHLQERLPELLWRGWDDVPTFFGGPNTEHDLYYPEESKCNPQGPGTLKFDFYGMRERMRQQKEVFDQEQQQQQKAEESKQLIDQIINGN